jgi:hypothetical protein
MWSTLMNILYELEKNVSLLLLHEVVCKYQLVFIVPLSSAMSFSACWICLFLLEDYWSLSLTMDSSISPSNSYSICFMYFDTVLLYKVRIIMACWAADSHL